MYKENFGNIANKDKIISYLEQGYKSNPGKWVLHSWIVGKTAQNMAKDLDLDPDIAFACGALHDIGKSTGAKEAESFYKGYKILRADSYLFPARIALSHKFPIKKVDSYLGEWNISEDKKDFVNDFIGYNDYNDYDLLIQYLDGVIESEYLGIEKSAEALAKKYANNPYFAAKKQRLYELEDYFKNKLKQEIEKYLPNPRWYKFPYKYFRENNK